jgi:hypothetical protein
MDEPSGGPGRDDREFWHWLLFWLQFAVLGALAIAGAGIASANAHPGDYACGLMLALSSIGLVLLLVKRAFDGSRLDWGGLLLVDDMRGLALAVPLFALIGFAGLVLARAVEQGSLHAAGLALFLVSAAIILLDVKRVFDRLERKRGR